MDLAGSVLRGCGAEGGEGWGGVEAGGEIADERDHGRVPESVEAEEEHFVQGLLGGPFFDGHAVGGDEDAGTVVAKTAMHEDFLIGIVAEERKELNDLCVRGWSPAADGDVDETHAERFGLLALLFDSFLVFAAKINDGGDAEFFEFGQALRFGLRAAIEMIVDFAAIGNGGDVKFFSVGRTHFGGCGIFLPRERARLEKESSEREKKQKTFHSGLDAKSVAREEKR